jgi:transcriptional regulator with XRE-family HTH domain
MLIAKLLRLYRKDAKLSVRELAKTINVDHTVLYRFEEGSEISGASWVRIVKWLLTSEE